MQFLVFINHAVDGPYPAERLKTLPIFSPQLLVCPVGEFDWRPASSFPILVPPVQDQAVAPDRTAPGTVSWRKAVISGDIPEMTYKAWQPPAAPKKEAPTAPKAAPAPAPAKAAVPEAPKPSARISLLKRFPRLVEGLTKHRKVVLMSALWSVALGIYQPHREFVDAIYEGLAFPAVMIPRPTHRSKRHAPAPKVGPWHRFRIFAAEPPAPKQDKTRPSAAASPEASPAAPVEREIALDDLGDGTMLKTVVITRMHDGITVEETKTYVVTKNAKPRKAAAKTSRKAKVKHPKVSEVPESQRTDFIL